MRYFVLIFFAMLCGLVSSSAHAQSHIDSSSEIPTAALTEFRLDTLARTYIYFRHDHGQIDSNYRDNRAALAAIRKALSEIESDSLSSISSIVVEGTASVLGHPDYNLRLSYQRAANVEKFLRTLPGLKDFDIRLVAKGEDWGTFTSDIRNNYHRRNKTSLLEILESDNLTQLQKKDRIRSMEPDSLTWRILIRDNMNTSRHAVTVVVVRKERMLQPLPRLKPFVVQGTHVKRLMPISQRNISDARTVFYAFIGNKCNAQTGADQIQRSPGCIHCTDHRRIGGRTANPLHEAFSYIIVEDHLRFSDDLLGIDE